MKEFFKIGFSVYGVRSKCRKSEPHYFRLGYIDFNGGNFNKEEIEERILNAAKINMRKIESEIHVNLDYVIVENENNRELFSIFDGKSVRFKIKPSSLENALL